MRYYLVMCPRCGSGLLLWADSVEEAGRKGRKTGLFPESPVLWAVWMDRPLKPKELNYRDRKREEPGEYKRPRASEKAREKHETT